MADRELVVKISEGMYQDIMDGKPKDTFEQMSIYQCLKYRIREGVPLPKGHRKLITEPTEEDIIKTVGGQNDFTECIKDAVKAVFDNADAIIEADKGDEGNDG